MAAKKSYLIKNYPCILAQRDYVETLLKPFSKEEGRLFRQVLASTALQKQYRGWIPISWEFRLKYFSGVGYEALQEAELLEVKPHRWKDGKSKEYKIPDEIRMQFLELGISLEDDADGPVWYNLITGHRDSGDVPKSAFTDDHGHPEPPLIQEAMRCIPYGYFNRLETLRYLRKLRSDVRQLAAQLPDLKAAYENLPPNSDDYKVAQEYYEDKQKDYDRLLGRYFNDRSTYQRVQRRMPEPTEWPGIYKFSVAWQATRTGRISGGFQSASREMKAAVYQEVPGFRVRNYDLKRSQGCILAGLVMAFAADIPRKSTEALFRFIFGLPLFYVDDDGSVVTQHDLGLSDDLIKEVVYGVIFGGNPAYEDSEIVKALLEEVDEDDLPGLQVKLNKMFGPLRKGIRTIADKILEGFENEPAHKDSLHDIFMGRKPLSELKDLLEYTPVKTKKPYDFRIRRIPAFSTHSGFGKGRKTYVTNATGKKFCLQDYPDRAECSRKLLSHIVQGAEAAAMHQLAINLSHKAIQVISHEHDGLVVLGGEITLDDLRQAQGEATVWMWSYLVEKPFADMIKRSA